MRMYSNEITIVFNVVSQGNHIIGGPAPHYIRIPEEQFYNVRDFLKSCPELKTYIDSLYSQYKQIIKASINYIVIQTEDSGYINVSDFIETAYETDVNINSLLLQSLTKILSAHGYEFSYNSMNYSESKNYAINILATMGINIIEIKKQVYSDILASHNNEIAESVVNLI